VHCVVAAPTTEFDLVTAHFMTPRFGLNATRENPIRGIQEWRESVSDRMAQATRLAGDVRLRTRPVIVAGDFNAPNSSLVVRALLDTGLQDAFAAAGVGYGFTYGHSLRFRQPFLRIDHILVGPEFGVANCFVGGSGAAHLPVIADLYVKDATAGDR
jgi:endonuclease/exonuclease/phosphatase (EEP) superfamily protein YafD